MIPAVRELSDTWEKEAAQRRQRTPADPAADAITSCASELRTRLAEIERDTAWLTVVRYATAVEVSPKTVRRLCASGLLDGAEKGPDGEWRIPRNAKRRTIAHRAKIAS